MGPDIDTDNVEVLLIENATEISFDPDRINRLFVKSGKMVNFVGSEDADERIQLKQIEKRAWPIPFARGDSFFSALLKAGVVL